MARVEGNDHDLGARSRCCGCPRQGCTSIEKYSILLGQQLLPIYRPEYVHGIRGSYAIIAPPKRLLEVRRVGSELRWIQSALSLHADRLSRSWDPRDVQLSRAALHLLRNLFTRKHLQPTFPYRRFKAQHPASQRRTAMAVLLSRLVRRTSTRHKSPSGPYFSDSIEARAGRRERTTSNPGLAEANLISGSTSPEPRMVLSRDYSTTGSGRRPGRQQTVEDSRSRGEHEPHQRREGSMQATLGPESVPIRQRLSPEAPKPGKSVPSQGDTLSKAISEYLESALGGS